MTMGVLKDIPILKKILEIGYTMLLIAILSALVGLILAFPVMLLWNYVFKSFPKLHINVFQAWALNVLAGILFGKTSGGNKK